MRRIACLLLVLPAVLTSSCGGASPVQEVMGLIEEVERLVQEGAVPEVAEKVSDRYRDDFGYDKRTVLRVLALAMGGRDAHLCKRVDHIEEVAADRVEAVVFVAVAAVPIPGPDMLRNVQADLLRFDAVFCKENDGKWRVTSAPWREAEPADFF